MPKDKFPAVAPRHWIEALERGRADIAAGRTVDGEELLRELEAEDAGERAAEEVAVSR